MTTLVIGAVALNVYSVLLLVGRAALFTTRFYRPMLLNIGLSAVPIAVLAAAVALETLIDQASRAGAIVVVIACAAVWLLFLPNSSYLITELNLSHRRPDDAVPLWYDVILVITLAMSGVTNTVLNVLIAHILFTAVFIDQTPGALTHPASIAMVCVVFLLVAFGMYLGRELRLNSWDVRHPSNILRKTATHFRAAGAALSCVGFTCTYAVFLAVMYAIIAGPYIEGLRAVERAHLLP